MSITHSAFLTQIRNYTEVGSNVLSDTLLDQFIRNIELDIAGKVDYDDIRKYVIASTTASQRYLNTPDDILVIRSIQVINSGTRDFLEKRDTSFIAEFNPTDATGQPKYYSLFDDTAFEVAPIPDSNYTVELHYLHKPASLTSGSDSGTTFLSTDYPDALLYGTLVEGAIFLKEPIDVVSAFEGRFKEAVSRMKTLSEGRGTRDEYRYDLLRTGVS